MDNLRPLSSSLPSRRSDQNSADLLASFKAAALSVTNLYKTAAADHAKSRQGGYQDALDDLLAFLDREKLGLMDGEGWKVRAWATERLDNGPSSGQRQAASSDDEAEEICRKEEDLPTVMPQEIIRRPAAHTMATTPAESLSVGPASSTTGPRHSSEPPTVQITQEQQSPPPTSLAHFSVPTADDFAFRSGYEMPARHDRQPIGMELDSASTGTATPAATLSTDSSSASIRIIPKHRRERHNSRRHNQQATPSLNLSLGSGAGNKRKLPYPDFFDISGVNFEGQDWRKDGSNGGANGASRGGKRGRHV